MEIAGLRALVTGGAGGIGRVFVERLLDNGARVCVCDRDVGRVADVAERFGDRVQCHAIDITNEAEIIGMFEAVSDAWGGLDLLVNNAGIVRDGLLVRRTTKPPGLRKLSLESWQAVLDVNLTGAFLCAREFAAQAIEREIPHTLIVNISSISRHGNPGQSNYSASKAGIVADTRLWASELGRYGVRVAAIAPGFVQTPILDTMPPERLRDLIARVPLGRIGQPEDIWQALRFLIACDYVTGACIDVDGGLRIG